MVRKADPRIGARIETIETEDVNACTDCHGVHDVAAMSPANIAQMKGNLLDVCQQCHEDIDKKLPEDERVANVFFDEDGKPMDGNGISGNLCLAQSWPGQARTIWGDHERFIQTYFFSDEMERVEFNPYWGIPQSIIRSKYLPKLRANPGYFEQRGYEVIILRDCGTAMESFETHDTLDQTRGTILFLEMYGKYSLTSEELIAGLQ